MSDIVNTATLDILQSVNSAADFPGTWAELTRAASTSALAIPQSYRKWTGTAVAEMTAGEKAAVDAAALTAGRASAMSQIDRVEDVLRAVVLLLLDELNGHAAKMNATLSAIDASTNYATLKTNIAGVADYPTRTLAQLRASIAAKLGT